MKFIFAICIISPLLCMLIIFSEPLTSITMTPEEKESYQQSITHEYEVVSVSSYMKTTRATVLGAVLEQELKYTFTYIDESGQLQTVDEFENTNYGLWKVYVGETNKYEVINGFDTYKNLYLTQETFNSLMIN